MKTETKKIIGIAAITLIIGLALGAVFFGGSEEGMAEDHLHEVELAEETIWTCSMHPQIRQNEAGNCPICGMELIPVENGDGIESDPAAIRMSQTAMQIASVSTEIVGKTKPVKLLRINGKVQPDERQVYSQSSHIPGRIERLAVNFTGEYVNRGQVLATVYSPELVNAQEELFEARKIAGTQPILFESAKEKLRNWKLSDRQVEQILESGKTRDELPIHADISGYVTEKNVNLGDYVNRGQVIYQIANLKKVWILLDIYESDMAWVKKGDEVSLSVQSLPGENFTGRISFIDPVLDPMTRVAKARVEVDNSDLRLKPEMFVSAELKAKLPVQLDAVVIPKSAVMWTGERSVVYVKNETSNGVDFKMRIVTLGPALGNGFVIKEGLRAGEEIAVNGTFSIDAAAQLAGKPSMMNHEGGPAMTGHNHGGTGIQNDLQSSITNEIESYAIGQEAKVALVTIFGDYLAFKDALVNDDLEKAKNTGSRFNKNIERIKKSFFTGEAQQVWLNQSGEIKKALEHIPHMKTLDEIRKSFEKVSIHMIYIESVFNANSEALYILHCPMANDNKGADWLSSSKEIRNPFYGEAMLTCGSVSGEL
ncbi:efflux RND transporter periplasmic adaptor subunit [Muriicola soli]|uniref:Efflux RND transporter periplasmic adaptor subunit n=1 Tax=Muriicola soli TaxID=2507538 RepID=A0A411EAJ0_9FLAO|nr:efflux RND transporter periplasmic adaptor subunit [Muriicola soli]QBA64534.1 efflux RND transporter periplasmic adaptor subunit [Muriicola soli]